MVASLLLVQSEDVETGSALQRNKTCINYLFSPVVNSFHGAQHLDCTDLFSFFLNFMKFLFISLQFKARLSTLLIPVSHAHYVSSFSFSGFYAVKSIENFFALAMTFLCTYSNDQ